MKSTERAIADAAAERDRFAGELHVLCERYNVTDWRFYDDSEDPDVPVPPALNIWMYRASFKKAPDQL